MTADARQIAALVPMKALLAVLGFTVNERTRRSACPLHGGSNPSAFAWREDGRWHCFSCGASGDRIALVRAVRACSFPEAVEFLAALAGVGYRARRVSRSEIMQQEALRGRSEQAAWKITDEIGRLRIYYTDALHRADRLCWRLGEWLFRALSETEREATWDQLARLAPAQTFFLAAWHFVSTATPGRLVRFALASPPSRRIAILNGDLL